MDNTKWNVLAKTILSLPETHKFSEDDVVVNDILDYIITNTLLISSCKLNTIQWKGKDKLYDIGIIYRDQYKLEPQSLKESWFAQYL